MVLSGWRRIPGPARDPAKARLLRLRRTLLRRLGSQAGHPGRSAYEIALGIVLTRHRASPDAAQPLAALRSRRLLDPRRLLAVPEADLAEIVGTGRSTARKARGFTAWLVTRFDGRFEEMRRAPLAALRGELRAVSDLGPETADAILLYAANRPVFVAGTSARRVLAHHRFVPAGAGYEAARAFAEAHLPSDPALFRELHGLLVAASHR